MAKAPSAPAPKPRAAQPQGKAAAKGQPRKGGEAAAAPVAKTRPKGTGEVAPRLKERFHQTVVAGLLKERGYTNTWQVPRLHKVVINMGVGEGRDNAKILDFATADLQAIADPKDGKPTRVGFKMVGDKKVRVAKRSGVEIDG